MSEQLENINQLFNIYHDELNVIAPNFAQEMAQILKIKTKQQNMKMKEKSTPHFSTDFTSSQSRLDKEENELVDLDLLEIAISRSNSPQMIFCHDCQEKHFMHMRMCSNCQEEHEGCCEVTVT